MEKDIHVIRVEGSDIEPMVATLADTAMQCTIKFAEHPLKAAQALALAYGKAVSSCIPDEEFDGIMDRAAEISQAIMGAVNQYSIDKGGTQPGAQLMALAVVAERLANTFYVMTADEAQLKPKDPLEELLSALKKAIDTGK